MASVQHIKQKPYYRPLSEEPDPTATCSTRLWKWKMKVWVETLKEQADRAPRRANAAQDVAAGSQVTPV